ncbi:MAG: aldehyde dehydrogenase family protein [Alcanivorax sp.]|jgi:aldehyde dehydrogenase (NAD+)|uniref:aldehyde dehydrogenase family protein n=1 Tax=Alcanivorax TaxID=59753 RepID=UPI000C8D36A0|nr:MULTISPECIES: aldehyde dehydrogenase family protein [Alcanivorax]MAC13825.1 aldehyde dehydrogenase family protein [Alcanivorax sp.]MDF1636209.1 aldehyde dehydrogenase family protein [Alcanivorax jadensis]MDF1724867.1 aldehyde dehydrogenase family protein [Alcanivorax sp.]|tara:strand:+ start:1865 stop:3289 length:1425 start_codon:yes stop_codon:yes gene_type:complete
MGSLQQFYINGEWVNPADGASSHTVINPATENPLGELAMGGAADIDAAISAAAAAFPAFSAEPLETRLGYLEKIAEGYQARLEEIAQAISQEMGAPISMARKVQAPMGLGHLKTTLAVARDYPFEEQLGQAQIRRAAAGVCALITPWNWPMNQVMCKVAPAIAAGCTMVLKPSEFAPLSAQILAEIIDEAGLPAGVFNMVHGDGAQVGPLLSSDPRIDVVSLTGSTRAGESVSREAAATIKRVSLELGGKSANILLPGCDLQKAVTHGVRAMMNNTGQSCNAPSRMLVPADQLAEAEAIAAEACSTIVAGDPQNEDTVIGPIANGRQYQRVQSMIEKGVEEGAKLVAGGTGKPDGLEAGYFARPTVFSQVSNTMTIGREEIFGPVLVMIPYQNVDEAVAIANDSDYGLSGYVFGEDSDARAVAARLRTGMVHINGAGPDLQGAFGGYKQSGNGREWGRFGLEEFLETQSLFLPS